MIDMYEGINQDRRQVVANRQDKDSFGRLEVRDKGNGSFRRREDGVSQWADFLD